MASPCSSRDLCWADPDSGCVVIGTRRWAVSSRRGVEGEDQSCCIRNRYGKTRRGEGEQRAVVEMEMRRREIHVSRPIDAGLSLSSVYLRVFSSSHLVLT